MSHQMTLPSASIQPKLTMVEVGRMLAASVQRRPPTSMSQFDKHVERVQDHPDRNSIFRQLRQNIVFKEMSEAQTAELAPQLTVVDCNKGDLLLHQGVYEMEQYFILGGILKRVVTNPEAKEMILRFAGERDIETSYAAWRLKNQTPYSIVCVTKARVVKMPLPDWVHFVGKHPALKQTFEFEVTRIMSDIMAHTITLHLLDAPGRVHRFLRKHAELSDCIPKKELASYLNMSAETLSRLKHQGKI